MNTDPKSNPDATEGCAAMAGSVSSEAPICSNCGHRAQLSHLDDDGAPHWGCAECGRRLNRMAIKTMGGNVWRRLVRNARKYRKEAACQGPQNVKGDSQSPEN